ncbi:MAG: hypothetical protein IJU39_06370 [Clostridia bacterium]|nr:hypothetical protein [Clostridia bacterium]
MIDIHSHVLCGVDDGSQSIEESVKMLRAAKEIGFDKIIATPHVMRAGYDKDKLKDAFSAVSAEAKKIGIELFQGYEYNCYALNDDGIEGALKFCTEGTNTILLEFKSTVGFPANWESIVMNLQREGAQIIIAHPERYPQVQTNIERIVRSVELGCRLQLDGLSLEEPGFMNKTRKCAKKLLESGMISYVASDAHSESDYLAFGEIVKKISDPRFFNAGRSDEYSSL